MNNLIYIAGFFICHILRDYIQYELVNPATITDIDCIANYVKYQTSKRLFRYWLYLSILFYKGHKY